MLQKIIKIHTEMTYLSVSMDDIVSRVNAIFVYFLLYIFGKCLIKTDLTLDTTSDVETSFLDGF